MSIGLVSTRISKAPQGKLSRFVCLKTQEAEPLPTCSCPVLVRASSEIVNSATCLVCICVRQTPTVLGVALGQKVELKPEVGCGQHKDSRCCHGAAQGSGDWNEKWLRGEDTALG